jgi:microsomal epoxide hydrolase
VLVDAAVSKGAGAVSANPKFVQSLLGNIDIYAKHKREYLEGMMHAIFTQKMSDADFRALVDTGMKTPVNTGIAELNADMLGADLTPALAKFDKPTLIVASANSFELAAQKAEAARLPRGSFAQIENAGHGVFVDQPDAFNRALGDFVKALLN